MDTFLVKCSNHDDYLDSFRTFADDRYIKNVFVERQIVALNYRSTIAIYTEEQFRLRKAQAYTRLYRKIEKPIVFSAGIKTLDPVLHELALRETLNQQKIISTIIYIRTLSKKGNEISGFIDFEQSLSKAQLKSGNFIDWLAVFRERALIRPQPSDLSYFNWHTGYISFNHTDNYRVLDDIKGVTFMHRGDRKKLCVTDSLKDIKRNHYYRSLFFSKTYGYVMFFDHQLTKRV